VPPDTILRIATLSEAPPTPPTTFRGETSRLAAELTKRSLVGRGKGEAQPAVIAL
jgi:hypothetical protein